MNNYSVLGRLGAIWEKRQNEILQGKIKGVVSPPC